MGIRDAVEFGPFLMINGKRSFVRGNGGWGIAPRTAIAQRQDGIVLFLVINGRLASSIGADMIDLCDVLENYGAYNAANLDGGSSSELVINQQIVNTPVAGGSNGLRDAVEFGPFLIVNGKRSFVKGNGGWGIAPRTAIGQRQDGIVLFLAINGRIPSSIGADMIDLCDVMEKYGAYNAANLDGGSSTELAINHQIINTPVAGGVNGLRDMSTFWVVK